MDPFSRLLVLDAALCAAEMVIVPDDIARAMSTIQDYLDQKFRELSEPELATAQSHAVEQLAKHPELYS